MRILKDQAGFTMVELTIATTIFATVLLVITFGIISMSNNYYKGINTTATQNVAAGVMNTITQALQLGGGNLSMATNASNVQVICLGNQEFISLAGVKVKHGTPPSSTTVGVFQQPAGATCNPADAITYSATDGQELLADNMRVLQLSLHQVGTTTDCDFNAKSLCSVTVSIGFGNDDDLFCDTSLHSVAGACDSSTTFASGDLANDVQTHPDVADIRCRTTTTSEFCAVSTLNTTVQRRL